MERGDVRVSSSVLLLLSPFLLLLFFLGWWRVSGGGGCGGDCGCCGGLVRTWYDEQSPPRLLRANTTIILINLWYFDQSLVLWLIVVAPLASWEICFSDLVYLYSSLFFFFLFLYTVGLLVEIIIIILDPDILRHQELFAPITPFILKHTSSSTWFDIMIKWSNFIFTSFSFVDINEEMILNNFSNQICKYFPNTALMNIFPKEQRHVTLTNTYKQTSWFIWTPCPNIEPKTTRSRKTPMTWPWRTEFHSFFFFFV